MSVKDHKYLELTVERMNALHHERKRTQTGSHNLLKGIKPKYGLTPGVIEHWLSNAKSARQDQYDYVLKRYAALPSYVELTTARVNAIRAEMERTALGTAPLLKKSEKIPAGLKVRVIEGWLYHTKHAKQEHYEFVLELYKSQPTNIECDDVPSQVTGVTGQTNAPRNPYSEQKPKRTKYIAISDEMRAFLNAEMDRTGVPINRLVAARPEWASKTTDGKVSRWRTGRAKKANKQEWEYIISALANRPDKHS